MSRLAHATFAAQGLEAERRNLDATVRHEAAQRATARPISDDDACATCAHCVYQPGEQSRCTQGWPTAPDADGYIAECTQHVQQASNASQRHLTCCVCGDDAGRWQQHWNRDAGYGICTQCAATEAGRETPERMASLYGQPGINYQQPTIKVWGRAFKVMAAFPNTDTGTARANAFMERVPGAAALEVSTARIYLAHSDDKGEPV